MSVLSKVVLVTGGARRIGAEIVRQLHQSGYSVIIHAHQSTSQLQTLSDELEQRRPGSTLAQSGDLRHSMTASQLIQAGIDCFGRLDAIVNNASNFFPTPVAEATPDQWDDLFAVNAKAPFFLAKAAARYLHHTQGCIVNVTDLHSQVPLRDHPIYSAAKSALAMLTKSLALELAPHVRVNAVAPGAILWPTEGKSHDAKQALLAQTPLARIGTPYDIARAVFWLIEEARYTTGQTLYIDGGRSLGPYL